MAFGVFVLGVILVPCLFVGSWRRSGLVLNLIFLVVGSLAFKAGISCLLSVWFLFAIGWFLASGGCLVLSYSWLVSLVVAVFGCLFFCFSGGGFMSRVVFSSFLAVGVSTVTCCCIMRSVEFGLAIKMVVIFYVMVVSLGST